MDEIEMAASDAAASALSGSYGNSTAEEIRAMAETLAYYAARGAGARPVHAAEVAARVVKEMTWGAEVMARI